LIGRRSVKIIRSTEQARRGRFFSHLCVLVQNRRPTEQARRRRREGGELETALTQANGMDSALLECGSRRRYDVG
jgi:hypothetical protein